eukprot:4635386-Amphidinium_carterae.1
MVGRECFDASPWSESLGISLAQVLDAQQKSLQECTQQELTRAGPDANEAVSCPTSEVPALDVPPQPVSADIVVHCLVPLVWPTQQPFLEAILRTFGRDCDVLQFFVSVGAADDVPSYPDAEVIDLRVAYPWLPPDNPNFHRPVATLATQDSGNTIFKLMHMLMWAATEASVSTSDSSQH